MVDLGDPEADVIISASQGFGQLGWNTAVKPAERPAMPLRIKDRDYAHGLGVHAPSEIVLELGGRYQTFEADLGVQWQGGGKTASVVFQVFVDDEKRFESPVVHEADAPRPVSVSVAGGEMLRLVVTDAGDGIFYDAANWAEARLIPAASRSNLPADHLMEMAAFARVVTSDPARMNGTRAGRTEEFPAEDVFLSTEVLPASDGNYAVPTTAGQGCIGLEWEENRELRYVGLTLAEGKAQPDLTTAELQYWTGESPWQGQWNRLDAVPQCDGRSAVWQISVRKIPVGTSKVRWIFPTSEKPPLVEHFQALTRSRCREMRLSLECVAPQAGQPCRVELYNGALLNPPTGGTAQSCTWDTQQPLHLSVRYSTPLPYKADRSVLRLTFPDAALTVAIEDLLTNDCVYVPSVGLFAVREPAPVTLAEYQQAIAGRQTVLEEVASRPDQTFAQAMATVHNPIQDAGPMMLSLACDNRKFVVEREGVVLFEHYQQVDETPRYGLPQCRLTPKFGSGAKEAARRYLDGDWLPIPVSIFEEQGVEYRQRSYVAPLDVDPPIGAAHEVRDRAACVMEYEIENRGDQKAEVKLELAVNMGPNASSWQAAAGRYQVVDGERLLVLADANAAAPLQMVAEGGIVRLAGTLEPKGQARLNVWIPAWNAPPGADCFAPDTRTLRAETERYWKGLLESAMQVEVPDPLLNNVLRASQVHCLLAARNEDRGQRISPWISSDRYGPLESEANSIIHGMGLWGHDDFARRSLDFFLVRYNPAGYLTTGYTLVGTGWNLWTLAAYAERSNNRRWLEQAAPTVVGACQWLVRQRAKTERLDPHGEKPPGYGLMPPGVSADWNRYAYRFFNDAHFCAGLMAAAEALKAVDHPEADALLAEAAAYREELLRAFRWMQVRMPVVPLRNGTWTLNHPGVVGFFGNVEEYTPGEDANRTWAGSVEIGSHYLVALGLLDPQASATTAMLQYLEDQQFLRSGWGDYPEATSRKDPFNLGGFAKVQPYYGRTPEIYALRDEPQPLIRAYFNAISALLSRENLSFWEHFHNGGGWNKTHETGWFLVESRLLLVEERGDELRLAPFVAREWLKDGLRVKVERAPTRFGPVGYEIRSAAAEGFLEATVNPPTLTPPESLVLRLRHPAGKRLQKVLVNGQPYTKFDAAKETITLPLSSEPIRVRAEY